ncbi:MAG: hypothetical protein OPY07_04985 [Nitrosopumilus sp.]|nr:hypothetical protein [Nitrosopumilus sp.]MDF2428589.1 hypothetical protein [Nitrosopumilus sp.]
MFFHPQDSIQIFRSKIVIAIALEQVMQYFQALKLGQKRVAAAREYLNTLTNGKAMPALALADTKSNVWEPVGEENMYAFVDESAGFVLTDSSGYILALVDKTGSSKTIVQGVTKQQKEMLEKAFQNDNILKFEGKVILPV